jgi:ABC-2 type transport system permease protein
MNPTAYAIRVGLSRGLIEWRATLTRVSELLGNYVMMPAVLLAVLFFQRDTDVEGTTLPLASLALPGVVAMLAGYASMIGIATILAAEREDGTLLRAKAVPNGMVGYVSGGIVRISLDVLFLVVITLVPALVFFDGLLPDGPAGVLTLAWVLALGLLASLPIGMIIGSMMRSPRAVAGWGFFLSGAVIAISGIFYPITALAGWVQVIGQIFPYYWLGLGMRSALLPDAAAAVEIGGSWRQLAMVGVLSAWAVAGLLVAPTVLRRMARRESGSTVAERRQKVLQRL